MDYRKFGLIVLLCLPALVLKAQVKSYQPVDSLTEVSYNNGRWQQLITEGDSAIKNGVDFSLLRLRLGYAQFTLGNYGAALSEYEHVLQSDSFNQTARFFMSLCYKYLNQDLLAARQAAYLDTTSSKLLGSRSFGVLSAGLESSYKIAENIYRGNASYTRFGLNSILFKKLEWDQSAVYFGQYIYSIVDKKWIPKNDQQPEYFAKLSYALSNNLLVFGGWHYLYTTYGIANYSSNLLVAGLAYTGAYADVQADAEAGDITGDHVSQYNARLTLRPLGNLNLYFIGRETWLVDNNKGGEIFEGIAGLKAFKSLWLESSATFGKLSDYNENDGLYIYNAIDDTKFKFGETIYYPVNTHAMIQLNYTFEQKQDDLQSINYNQHSITAGLLWKF